MIRPALDRLLVPAALLALAGCVGSLPPLERYRLRPAPAPAARADTFAAPDSGQAIETIAVEPYVTTGIYADPQIVYRVGETAYGAYLNREWALPLSRMLADATVQAMRAARDLGSRVTDERSGAAHGLVWRGVVQQFEEVDRGTRIFAVVHLDATLVRTLDDSLVWQSSADLERPVADTTMPGVVDALSDLTAVAIGQLVHEAGVVIGTKAIGYTRGD